ncbi:MAG: winged helix-turn-helix domain-containing protein [Anaerolineae bacterium]|nr:winged helix-turn-helix domain-containing protein [Anaerolineae bacterium]
MSGKERITISRQQDAAAILEMLSIGQSVSIIGLSNFGKSTLLRYMAEPQIAQAYLETSQRPALFVYVDCNRMLEMSAQGFYEVILRAVLETLSGAGPDYGTLIETIEGLYRRVVESQSTFTIPLAFNDAIIAMIEAESTRDVIVMLDEFDAVLTDLDERVFLNLRALKDKYAERLNYLTATLQPLSSVGGGDDLAEFLELFAAYKYHLKPLNCTDAVSLASDIFHQANDSLDPPERDYILAQAGGHPGLIQAVAHVVMEVESGAPANFTQQALSMADDVLENHRLVRTELGKLWKQMLPHERKVATLIATRGVDDILETQRFDLLERGLLVEDEHGVYLFSRLLAHYARRKALVQQDVPDGVWVDIDAGTVWLSGQVIEPLTDLEYRLLLLLYGRLNKICDKYQIVEAVWGQEYLGEVDDARIEKLVSRLRSKLEPDPSHPQYINTVRGRGYKLVGARHLSSQ